MYYEYEENDSYLYGLAFNKEIFYIGITLRELYERTDEHPVLISYADTILFIKMKNEANLKVSENTSINQYKPAYNIKNKYKGKLSPDKHLKLKWETLYVQIKVDNNKNGFNLKYVMKLMKILTMINNNQSSNDINSIIKHCIRFARQDCEKTFFHNQQIIWDCANSKKIIIKGRKHTNPNGLIIKLPTENIHYSKVILDDLAKQILHYSKVFHKNGINVYVETKESYLQQYGNFIGLDKKLKTAYLAATGKSNVSQHISSLQKGYIFVWESPFPENVTRDEEFAKIIDFSYIISEYIRSIGTSHLIRYYPFAKEHSETV